jgi:hypothetical protein
MHVYSLIKKDPGLPSSFDFLSVIDTMSFPNASVITSIRYRVIFRTQVTSINRATAEESVRQRKTLVSSLIATRVDTIVNCGKQAVLSEPDVVETSDLIIIVDCGLHLVKRRSSLRASWFSPGGLLVQTY